MSTDSKNQRWFALRVRSRYERAIGLALKAKGYEAFVPVHKLRRRWSDRMKELQEPFFPG